MSPTRIPPAGTRRSRGRRTTDRTRPSHAWTSPTWTRAGGINAGAARITMRIVPVCARNGVTATTTSTPSRRRRASRSGRPARSSRSRNASTIASGKTARPCATRTGAPNSPALPRRCPRGRSIPRNRPRMFPRKIPRNHHQMFPRKIPRDLRLMFHRDHPPDFHLVFRQSIHLNPHLMFHR